MRLPDAKSRPRLSCSVAKAMAPIIRITPEIEKKYLLMPGEVEVPAHPLLVAVPMIAFDCMTRVFPNTPRKAWVKTTAVNRRGDVPTPRVKAKPLTPAVESTNRMKAVISVITFASMIVPMPWR